MKLKRKCPLCSSSDGESLRTIDFNLSDKIKLPPSYEVVACQKCGFLFADSTVTEKQLSTYYKEENIYENISHIQQELYLECCNAHYHSIEPFCNKDSNVLDMGCGNGTFLKYLQEKGFHLLTGIELDIHSIEKLKLSGIKGYQGSIYDKCPDELEGKFDFIISTGVLEHLLDVRKAISNVKKYLKQHGRIYIAVPNAEGFPEFEREIPNYFNQEHINYFTKNTLDMLMVMYGFKRISSEDTCYYVISKTASEVTVCSVYELIENLDGDVNYPINKDMTGKKATLEYFEMMQNKEDRTNQYIKSIIGNKRRVVIWGTGSYAMHILGENKELLQYVDFFVDNNSSKCDIEIFGKKVYLPEKLLEQKNILIIICVMLNPENVVQQMQRMQISNEYTILCNLEFQKVEQKTC